jgi:hypothetical protein
LLFHFWNRLNWYLLFFHYLSFAEVVARHIYKKAAGIGRCFF